jgi:DNA-binding NtrC family response regulator
VLILGETGVGKELIARALLELSKRRNRPYVPLNCGSIPEGLLEGELFGHVAGAFTGALRDRVGYVEAADGGTLFLDEIAEMSSRVQAALLRFLESGEYSRVGETRIRKADVRVLAATHADLDSLVAAEKFRADLYHRLRESVILLAPLRDRLLDLLDLAEHFIRLSSRELKKPCIVLRPPVMRVLLAYSWPGNVRQLRNLIMDLTARHPGSHIRTEDLGPHLGNLPDPDPKPNEKAELEWALAMAGEVVSDAALYFGCARAHFYRLMRKHGLRPPEHRRETGDLGPGL